MTSDVTALLALLARDVKLRLICVARIHVSMVFALTNYFLISVFVILDGLELVVK